MSVINQKEYLKKYLSTGSKEEKKKKRKKKVTTGDRVKIIDDDIDLSQVTSLEEATDLLSTNEDAPQVVGVIDERPLHLRIDDYRKSDLWKPLGAQDDERGNSPRTTQRNIDTSSSRTRDGGSTSKSEHYRDEVSYKTKKDSSDYDSPPRKDRRNNSPPRRSKHHDDTSCERNRNKSESPQRKSPSHRSIRSPDRSPPHKFRRNSDNSPHRRKSDNSPPLRRRESDSSPPRKKQNDDYRSSRRRRRDSDSSPSRKNKTDAYIPPRRSRWDSNNSPPRKKQNDDSPPRRNRRDSDNSPLRKKQDDDNSPPRRNRRDSDNSPPRKKQNDDNSPPRRRRRDSDNTPPRKTETDDYSPPRKNRRDSDSSPPRKKQNNDSSPPRKNRKGSVSPISKNQRDNDSSPPRRKRTDSDNKINRDIPSSSSFKPVEEIKRKLLPGDKKGKYLIPAKRNDKMTKTLDGKNAGLQSAQELVKENEAFREREDELFKNLSAEMSGVNAAPVLRDKATGKIRDLQKEAEEQKEKNKKEEENKVKYSRWGRGLKQVEDYEEKLAQDLHEMSKPLARYADDEDLERFLKEQEREGDPMLDYIRKKKKKKVIESGKPLKPQYEGEFMPNRFGIRPGYRWDGVDRSNGYEKKWFQVQNAKRAQQEEIYKWSTEDM